MTTYDDIKAFWADELIQVPPTKIKNCSIPEKSKEFLISVGVPTSDDLLFPFFKNPEDFFIWTHESQNYLVLAEERGEKLCLRCNDGNIYVIDSRGELPTRFVNSNVESLVKCLQFFSEAKRRYQENETLEKIIESLRRKFAKQDTAAISGDENWWSVILEQIEQGLM